MTETQTHIPSFGPEGPEMTFPEAVKDCVCAAYDAANSIVEYGSGGSTAYGAAKLGKEIWSVEGSKDWHAAMQAHFKATPPKADLHLIHADIGETGEWSWPKGAKAWRRYPEYCFGVWQREPAPSPDLVLIDGRFRAGCFLATLASITKPCRVLFDDYRGREDKYAHIERFAQPVMFYGRMAQFELEPIATLPSNALFEILKTFQRPA